MKTIKDILINKKILYVEDYIELKLINEKILSYYFNDIYSCSSEDEALEIVDEENIDIAILDIELDSGSGISLAKRIKDIRPRTKIIFLSAFNNKRYLHKAIKLGINDYLIKPLDINYLLDSLDNIYKSEIEEKRLVIDNKVYIYNNSILKSIDNDIIYLGKKENKLLLLLFEYRPKILLKRVIDEEIWDYDMTENNYRSLIRNLRDKIGKDSILTIPSVGIKLLQ